eukprot:TRINITY_DN3052_c0_g4_i1.p1 TRINITY_DN3052_c0_g4~~TRINITY_DN3052_c0_g4_i1.p1  ORF type:complete len:1964 (+),score=483.94 TRINITY_DN3052_c0_g4_i1:58-5949(+)
MHNSMKRHARKRDVVPTVDTSNQISESLTPTRKVASPHAVRGPVLAEELRDLSSLHTDGDLNQKEYSAAKHAVIGIVSPDDSTTPPTNNFRSTSVGPSSLRPPQLSPTTAPPQSDQIILLQRENAGLKSTVDDLMNRLSRKVNVTKLMDEVQQEREEAGVLRKQLQNRDKLQYELYGGGEANRLKQENRLLQQKLSELELQKMNADENKRAEIARLVASNTLLEKDLQQAEIKYNNLEAVNELLRSDQAARKSVKSSSSDKAVSGLVEGTPHSQRVINDLQQQLLDAKRREIDLQNLLRTDAEDIACEVSTASAERNKLAAELLTVQEQLLASQADCTKKSKTIASLKHTNTELEALRVADRAALEHLQEELHSLRKSKTKKRGSSSSSSSSSHDAGLFSASDVGSSPEWKKKSTPKIELKSDPQQNVKQIKSEIELKVLQEENANLRDQLHQSKRLSSENTKLKEEIAILKQKQTHSDSDSSSSSNSNKSTKRQLSLYKTQLEANQNKVAHYEEENATLANRLNLCQIENKELQYALENLHPPAKDSSSSDSSDNRLKRRNSDLRKELEMYKIENDSLQNALADQLRKSMASSSSSSDDSSTKNRNAKILKENTSLKQKVRECEQTNLALQEALSAKLQSNSSSSSSEDNTKIENKKLRRKLEDLQHKYDKLYEQIGKQTGKSSSSDSSEDNDNEKVLKKKLVALQQKYDNLYDQLGRPKQQPTTSNPAVEKELRRDLATLQTKYDSLYKQLGTRRKDSSSSSDSSSQTKKLIKAETENRELRKQITKLEETNNSLYGKLMKKGGDSSSDSSSKDLLMEFSKCRAENSDLRQRLAAAVADRQSSPYSDASSSKEVVKLKKETSRLKKTIKSLEDELADRADQDRDTGATAVLQRTIKKLDSENTKLRDQLSKQRNKDDDSSSSSSSSNANRQKESSNRKQQQLQRDNDFLKKRVTELENIKFNAPAEDAKDSDLRSELQAVQKKSLQQYAVNSNLQKRIQDLETQLEDVTAGGTNAQVRSLRSQLDELQTQNDRLYEDKLTLLKFQHENARLKKQLNSGGSDSSSDSTGERNDHLSAENDKLKIENATLVKTVNDLQRSLYQTKSSEPKAEDLPSRRRSISSSSDSSEHAENLRSEISRLQEKNRTLDSEITSLQQKNRDLESNMAAKKIEFDELKASSEKSEKAHQNELRQLKSDSIFLQKQIQYLQSDDCSDKGSDSSSGKDKKQDSKSKKLAELQNEVASLKEELRELQASHAADCDENYQTRLRNIQLEDEIKTLRTRKSQEDDNLEDDIRNQAETIENLTSKIQILKHNEAQLTQKIANQSRSITELKLKQGMRSEDGTDKNIIEDLQTKISTQQQEIDELKKSKQRMSDPGSSSDSDSEKWHTVSQTPLKEPPADTSILADRVKDLEDENSLLERQNLRLLRQISNRTGQSASPTQKYDSDSSSDEAVKTLKRKMSDLKTENDDLTSTLRERIRTLENQNNRLLLLQQRTPTQQFVEGSRAADLELENQNLKSQVRSLSTPRSYPSPTQTVTYGDDTADYNRTRQKIAIILQARTKWLLTNRLYRMLWYHAWIKGTKMRNLVSSPKSSAAPLPPPGTSPETGKSNRVHVGITAATESDGTGVLIAGVHAGSPAAISGFQKDDIIIEMNQREILSPNDLVSVVESLRPTDSDVPVIYIRNGEILQTSMNFTSTADNRSPSPAWSGHESPPRPIDSKCSPVMLNVRSPIEELRELKHEKEVLNARLERAESAVYQLQDKISMMSAMDQGSEVATGGEGEIRGSSNLSYGELQRNLMRSERRRCEVEQMLEQQNLVSIGSDLLLPNIAARVGELFVTTPSGAMLTLIYVVASDCEAQPGDVLLKIGRQFVTTLAEASADLSHWPSSFVPMTVLRPSSYHSQTSSSTLLQLEINVSDSTERHDEEDAPDSPTPPPTAPPPTLSKAGVDQSDSIDIEVAWI